MIVILLLRLAKYDRLAWASRVTSLTSGLPHSTLIFSMCHFLSFMVTTHLLRLDWVYHLT